MPSGFVAPETTTPDVCLAAFRMCSAGFLCGFGFQAPLASPATRVSLSFMRIIRCTQLFLDSNRVFR